MLSRVSSVVPLLHASSASIAPQDMKEKLAIAEELLKVKSALITTLSGPSLLNAYVERGHAWGWVYLCRSFRL